MHPVRKQRLYIVLFIVVGASIAAALIFYALRENMNLFYSPSDIAAGKAPLNTRMRAGGMVREGSVQREGEALQVNFVDLRNWVMALEDFDDAPEHCGERILEAIQMAWIEEAAD